MTLGSQLNDHDLFHFKGEDEIYASLIDGPVTDWNWITRRDSGTGKVSILLHPSDKGDSILVYSPLNACEVQVGQEEKVTLLPEEAILFDQNKKVQLISGGPLIAASWKPFSKI